MYRWLTARWLPLIEELGADVLASPLLELEKNFLQHGRVNVWEHSIMVACLALQLAYLLHVRVEKRSLVRGALLHDFFLYDWHVADPSHRLHGYTHPKRALRNAQAHFTLNKIEQNIIKTHMFPLTLRSVPRYRESILVCLADKISAVSETLGKRS